MQHITKQLTLLALTSLKESVFQTKFGQPDPLGQPSGVHQFRLMTESGTFAYAAPSNANRAGPVEPQAQVVVVVISDG